MNIFAWIVVGYLAVTGLVSVRLIGRPRKVFTHGDIISFLITHIVLIGMVVLAVSV